MKLVSVSRVDGSVQILYELLRERTPEQSISHKQMPSLGQHEKFVASRPYEAWYLIEVRGAYVGSIYLSRQREVGIFVFAKHRGHGYGRRAIAELRKKYPGALLANINPANDPSIALFESLGGKVIQHTYQF